MSKPVPAHIRVSTPFGVRGPMWSSGVHQGVDFACPVGTDVFSPVTGKVVGVGSTWGSAFGRHQIIIECKHKKKHALKARTYYVILAHCSQAFVKPGDLVKAGQRVGKSGAEGNVSGPHLHMEVQTTRSWSRKSFVDPQFVLDIPAVFVYLAKKAPTTTSAGGHVKVTVTQTHPAKKAPAAKKPVKKAPAKKAPAKKPASKPKLKP